MARSLLAEGRAGDVGRMLAPLATPLPDDPAAADAGAVLVRSLLARVRLLRHGDPEAAMELIGAFEPVAVRHRLAPDAHAEVALWLGWTRGWEHAASYDDARALNLLEEASALFRDQHRLDGLIWVELGRAQAYLAIDEYRLLQKALDDAARLHEPRGDREAALWWHDRSALAERFRGRFEAAQHHLDALRDEAEALDDGFARGRADAYQASLDVFLGRSPEAALERAQAAERRLRQSARQPGYPLLAALRDEVRLHLRRGAWDTAERLLDRHAADATLASPVQAHLQLERARLAIGRHRLHEAASLAAELDRTSHRLRHRLLSARVALVQSTVAERQQRLDAAQAAAERAYARARETGHRGQQFEALLHRAHLSLHVGDRQAARALLAETEPYAAYFSVLPQAALRFRVLARAAELDGQTDDARTYLAQALSAYALCGDRYRTAQTQLAIAQLTDSTDPVRARPLLDDARTTFDELGAIADVEAADHIAARWPEVLDPMPTLNETTIGASLARAAVSVQLVAETWLQAAEQLLPDRWLGVYEHDEGHWRLVHEHGTAPDDLPLPEPLSVPTGGAARTEGRVRWLRLRGRPGPVFLFGVEVQSDDADGWHAAVVRMKPWLPVAALAFDHALLRVRRLEPADASATRGLEGLVYASPAMREAVAQLAALRASHSPVCITGEPGVGKGTLARTLHALSERHAGPFVRVDCATVEPETLDARLFGSGHAQDQPALVAADGGTLFLDDVAALPADAQHKLLRIVQSGSVCLPGASAPQPVDVRLVTTTTEPLERTVRAGRFDEDLYYRLHTLALDLPPLRERPEDIPLLTDHFLHLLRPAGTPRPVVTRAASEALARYAWPGNVRQLRNEIERVLLRVASEPAPTIDLGDLSPAVRASASTAQPSGAPADRVLQPEHDLDDVLADTEKMLIERVLAKHGGQVSASADALGLSRQGLYKKMKRLGIDAGRFQPTTTAPAAP